MPEVCDDWELLETIDDNRKLTFDQAKEKAIINSKKGGEFHEAFKQSLNKKQTKKQNLEDLRQLSIWHVIKLKNEFIEVSEKALGNNKSLFCTNG